MKTVYQTIITTCAVALATIGCAGSKEHSHDHGSHSHAAHAHGDEAKKPAAGQWVTLFDGKSTDAWRAFKKTDFPSNAWTVQDGTLKTIVGNGVDIVTKEQYEDFELELEWKVSPGGNSGVIYRATEDFDQVWFTGPEMQVLDDAKHADGKNPKTSAGALYALIAPTNKQTKPVGEWNKARLLIKKNHVEHWLNGAKIVEYELGSDTLKNLIAASKFAPQPEFAKKPKGHIVLQHHHDEVWYRNIRVRSL